MTVYHIVCGMPNKIGLLDTYKILCSCSKEDSAMQYLDEFGKCKDVEQLAAGVYRHMPSGELIEMMVSCVLE